MRNKQTNDETIKELQKKLNDLSDEELKQYISGKSKQVNFFQVIRLKN